MYCHYLYISTSGFMLTGHPAICTPIHIIAPKGLVTRRQGFRFTARWGLCLAKTRLPAPKRCPSRVPLSRFEGRDGCDRSRDASGTGTVDSVEDPSRLGMFKIASINRVSCFPRMPMDGGARRFVPR